jgi:tetratricopeptide (TPR) repeat protein
LGYRPVIAETLAFLGTARYRSGSAHEAESILVEASMTADASRHDEVRAETAVNLVYVVGYQGGRSVEARRWAEVATAVLQRLGGHDLLRAWLLNDLGAVFHLQGDRQGALESAQQALMLKERTLGRDHPDVGMSEGNLALALSELEKNDEALIHINRSIAVLRNGLGAGHPDLANQLSNRGEILNALGKHKDARESFEQAQRIWERELGTDSPALADALTGIGTAYIAEGNPANAIIPLERARKIRESSDGLSKVAETNFALAKALWEAGRDRARAVKLAEEARAAYLRDAAEKQGQAIENWIQRHRSG